MQLIDLIDRVLDMLDADPAFAFTLDGQLATVDDYARPTNLQGPWQVAAG